MCWHILDKLYFSFNDIVHMCMSMWMVLKLRWFQKAPLVVFYLFVTMWLLCDLRFCTQANSCDDTNLWHCLIFHYYYCVLFCTFVYGSYITLTIISYFCVFCVRRIVRISPLLGVWMQKQIKLTTGNYTFPSHVLRNAHPRHFFNVPLQAQLQFLAYTPNHRFLDIATHF